MRDIKQRVDTNSTDFKQGVEAGLNSAGDTKNWQAGNELGRELKDEVENKEPVPESLSKENSLPLFMSDSSEGKRKTHKMRRMKRKNSSLVLALHSAIYREALNLVVKLETGNEHNNIEHN